MAFEKELLGFYVTGHPLNPYRSVLNGGSYTPVIQLNTLDDRGNFHIAGSLASVEKKYTKKEGKPFAIIVLEDLSGSIEAMVWNDVYNKCVKLLEPGQMVALSGTVRHRNEELQVVINEVAPLRLPKLPEPPRGPLRLRFEMESVRSDVLGDVREILAASPGDCPVELEFRRADGHRLLIQVGVSHHVRRTPELEARLAERLAA